MHEVDRESFEALMADGVAARPAQFRQRIENLSFIVEDWAHPQDMQQTGTRAGSTLLGLYRGIPLTRRGSGYNLAMPDVIVLFQQPLQRIARDADHLEEIVAHTVRHEVAHYFGISDARLRELEAY